MLLFDLRRRALMVCYLVVTVIYRAGSVHEDPVIRADDAIGWL
jgi:hypothetical protein